MLSGGHGKGLLGLILTVLIAHVFYKLSLKYPWVKIVMRCLFAILAVTALIVFEDITRKIAGLAFVGLNVFICEAYFFLKKADKIFSEIEEEKRRKRLLEEKMVKDKNLPPPSFPLERGGN